MPEITSLSGNHFYGKKLGVNQQQKRTVTAKAASVPLFGVSSQTDRAKRLKASNEDSFQPTSRKRKAPQSSGTTGPRQINKKTPAGPAKPAESDTENDSDDVMTFDLNESDFMKALPFLMMAGQPGGPQKNPFEKPANFADQIRPFTEDDPELEAYKEAGEPFADKLSEISSRAYLHNAVLKSDNEQMKKGILMKLKEKLGHQPMFSVDCSPEKLQTLKRDERGGALSHAFTEAASKMGLPSNKPTVLVLNNASPSELDNLKRKDAYERIKAQNPHFRFIVNDAGVKESGESEGGFKAAMLKSLLGGGNSGPVGPTAPFEVVEVPPINAKQWHGIIQKDQQAEAILKHYGLNFPQDAFKEFLDELQRQKQAPLDREQILSELDTLGSFLRTRKQDTSREITKQHINQFSREVLNPRKKPEKADPNSPLSMMPKPYDVVNASEIKTRLEDVVGNDEAKQVLAQALESVQYPALYGQLDEGDEDAQNNRVLMLGEPGGGKTMLARAIAGQGKGTFISTSGSRFVNMFVGSGANNMRRLKAAIEESPDDLVVVFMDEIDSLSSRDGGPGSAGVGGLSSHEEENKTINEFLALTEGVSPGNKKVLMIGATNRPKALDEAILSRFHHKLKIEKLDTAQRKQLLENQIRQKNLDRDASVNLDKLAEMTEGLSGRDLRNLMVLAKQELIRQIPASEKARLEGDAQARRGFKLKLTQEVLLKAMKDVKNGWKDANNKGQESPPPFGMYV